MGCIYCEKGKVFRHVLNGERVQHPEISRKRKKSISCTFCICVLFGFDQKKDSYATDYRHCSLEHKTRTILMYILAIG